LQLQVAIAIGAIFICSLRLHFNLKHHKHTQEAGKCQMANENEKN
jgi:hypothetical protein